MKPTNNVKYAAADAYLNSCYYLVAFQIHQSKQARVSFRMLVTYR